MLWMYLKYEKKKNWLPRSVKVKKWSVNDKTFDNVQKSQEKGLPYFTIGEGSQIYILNTKIYIDQYQQWDQKVSGENPQRAEPNCHLNW